MNTYHLSSGTSFEALITTMLMPDDPGPLQADLIVKAGQECSVAIDPVEFERAGQLVIDRYIAGKQSFEGSRNGGPGAIAGDVLMFLMQMDYAGTSEPSLSKARLLAAEYAKGAVHDGSSKVGYSRAAVKGYWRQFRRVAHLWAALRVFQFQDDDPRSERIFGRIVDDIGGFLSIAKCFQDFADGFIPVRERNPSPILPANAYRIAEDVPIGSVTPPPLEFWQKDALARYTHS